LAESAVSVLCMTIGRQFRDVISQTGTDYGYFLKKKTHTIGYGRYSTVPGTGTRITHSVRRSNPLRMPRHQNIWPVS